MSFDFAANQEQENFSKILWGALVLSVLLHAGFFVWAWNYDPPRFGETYYEQIVPRKFRVERVEIDPAALVAEEPELTPAPVNSVLPVDLPPESVSFDSPRQPAPAAPRLDPTILQEAEPMPASEFASTMNSVRTGATGSTVAELDELRRQLLESESSSPARPTLTIPDELLPSGPAEASGPGLRLGTMRGYSELDDLLGQTGPLEQGTAPIFMPGDLLFAYDESELQAVALESLQKLGTLILRNPDTNFLIEGHTDSFGSTEYNMALSERRALAVKEWLVNGMGIDPARIRTKGLGSTNLVAPASGSIEEQQLNRRVEIVLEVQE
jgi:outer membrane protein OmpA-like peptidoglycan-associated protein